MNDTKQQAIEEYLDAVESVYEKQMFSKSGWFLPAASAQYVDRVLGDVLSKQLVPKKFHRK